jgi:hypothetical protein
MLQISERERPDGSGRGDSIGFLWAIFLVPALAWMIGFNTDYALVRVACTEEMVWPLHVVTVTTLALAIGAGVAAWGRLPRGSSPFEVSKDPRLPDGVRGRPFMLELAILSSGFFSFAIVVQWLTKLFLNPCMGI